MNTLKRLFVVLLALSVVLTSCRPSPAIQGGEGEEDWEQVRVSRENISAETLPFPMSVESAKVSIPIEGEEPILVDQSTASATTDTGGLVAYEDLAFGATVPVKVTDENGNPLSGMEVAYFSDGSRVSVAISDPQGKYAPEIVTLTREELFARAELSLPKLVRELGVMSAEASPEKVAPLVAAIVIALVVISEAVDYYLTADGVREVFLSRHQVVGYADGEGEYICQSPEYYSSRAGAKVDLVLVFVPGPTGRGGRMLFTWAGNLLGLEVETLSERMTIDEPILFRRYYYSLEKQKQLVYQAANISREVTFKTFDAVEPLEETVGRCVYVSDLKLVRVSEARVILNRVGISPEYYDVQCQTGPVSCDDQFIIFQDPEADKGTLVGRERQMFPILKGKDGKPLRTLYLLAEPSLVEYPSSPPTDYANLGYFLAELKRAVETADGNAADELIVPDSMGDYPFGNWAYWWEGIGLSHKEALDWFEEYASQVETVDVSDRAGELYALLADPKPETGPVALVWIRDRPEPSFFLTVWYNGRYWWSGHLSVPCGRSVAGPEGVEASRRFCEELGISGSAAPSEPLNTYDPSSVIDWVSYGIRGDPSVFEDLVGEEGAAFARYATEYVSPGYDNGEEIAEALSKVIVDSDLACVGYVEEMHQTFQGMGRWKEMQVVFDGIDLSPVGLSSDTDYAQFLFRLSDLTPGYVLMAIGPIDSFGVTAETRDLSPCP